MENFENSICKICGHKSFPGYSVCELHLSPCSARRKTAVPRPIRYSLIDEEPRDTCYVCGKKFYDLEDESTGICSVSCQISRYDEMCKHGYVINCCVLCKKESDERLS